MNHINRNGCQIEITEHHAKTAGTGVVVFIAYLAAAVLVGSLVITKCAVGV